MRDAHDAGTITTAYRYVDWILTVPLMCGVLSNLSLQELLVHC